MDGAEAFLQALTGVCWIKHLEQFVGSEQDWNKVENELMKSACYWKHDEVLQVLYIVYPGTSGSIRGWLRNFVAFMYRGEHVGFRTGVRYTLNKELRSVIRKVDKVFVFGYSQGGGQGQILQRTLRRLKKENVLFTFASPRAVSFRVARKMKDAIHYRITNGKDIVPNVPIILMGFKHAGHNIKVKGDKTGLFSGHCLEQYFKGIVKLSRDDFTFYE